jgi:dTDP-glucose pyrophosphorylase
MISQHIINEDRSVLDALHAINSLKSNETLTLFVTDKDNVIIGSLTDGDIRRSLTTKGTLSTKVGNIAHRNFIYLMHGDYDLKIINSARNKGIELLPVLDKQHRIVDLVNLKKHKSFLPIDAVLMAGGKGERLRPLTDKTPKPLIKIGGKAIIDYNVERLISYGLKNIHVTINYLGEQLEEHFSSPINGVKVETVREPNYLGTMGSIQFVKEFHHDTILVMNSDLFTNIDYEDFYLHFKEHNADMSVAAIPYDVNIPFGIFDLDGRDIKGVKEKPSYHYYANAGIYLIKKDVLKHIPQNEFFNATDLIEELVKQNMKVIRFPITGYWIDIGQHSELVKANELVKHLK